MDHSNLTRRDAIRILAGAVALGATRMNANADPTNSALHVRTIPSSGETLPVIGLGTWQTFDVGSSTEARAPLKEVLAEFARLGGKLVDSSPMYGESEKVAGDLMAELALPSRLFVATKVWTSGKRAGIEQMERSMQKLRADPVDLLQVHNLVDAETHLSTLRDWKLAGRVRYIGVTHYTTSGQAAIERLLSREVVDFIQINYSVGEREAGERLLPFARERGVAVIINRPFAGGDLFRQVRRRSVPDFAAEIDCTTWAQLLLKYVIAHPAVTCAIPATSKVGHLRDNLAAGTGRLPDEALRHRIAAEALR